MDFWQQFFGLFGAFALSGFALMRYVLSQQRSVVDRLVGFLERSMRRQEELNERFQAALEGLTDNVRENSQLLARVVERIGV